MDLVKPPALKRGDTIGIVAPCLPLLPQFKEQFKLGVKKLEQLGFKLKLGKTLELQHWWSGGSPDDQAEDINLMFKDPEVKALIALAGGHTAIGVLELLDYKMITEHPKPFMGMSDMTSYHLALYTKSHQVGFHMDEICFGVGMNWPKAEKKAREQVEGLFVEVLLEPRPLGNIPPLRERKVWRTGKAEGVLIGGNLNSLTRLVGSTYFPPIDWFNGAILFWEAVGLSKYEISQMLYQLKYHGVFERISGMLVGTITAVQPIREAGITEPTVKELTLAVTKGCDFPILAGMDFGHYTLNMPMLIGLRATMDTGDMTFKLLESAVKRAS